MRKIKKKGNGFPLGYLLFAVTFIAIGLFFIIFTSQSIDIMCYLIGGVTVFAAAFNAVIALAEKKRGGIFYLKLILCIFAIVSGIIVIISKESALEYIIGTVAFLLIIDASFKLQTVIKGKALKVPLWWALIILIIGCYVCAVFLIKFYNPEKSRFMAGLLGCILIGDGVLNMLTPFYLFVIARKTQRELSDRQESENNSEENTEKNKNRKER